MEQIEIGLWVTAGLLVLVVAGMRVALAAALAGVVGLVLIFGLKKILTQKNLMGPHCCREASWSSPAFKSCKP